MTTEATATLKKLLEGNQRFVEGNVLHSHQNPTHRQLCAKAQTPHTAVLACADSRVPPEILFDQGLGDLFVMRVAGNIINKMILGSLEYTVEHLGTRLILVLGHSDCGAVAAALSRSRVPGHLASIVQPIQNLAEKFTKNGSPPDVDGVVRENVRQTVKNIYASQPILSKMIKDGGLEVAGAIYHLESGKIELL